MTTDLRTLIRSADPVTGDRYDDAALLDRARRVLTDSHDTTAATIAVVDGVDPVRRRRPVAMLAVAAALAAATVAVPTVLALTSQGSRHGGTASEPSVGGIVATDPAVLADQYWKVTRTTEAFLTSPRSVTVDGTPPSVQPGSTAVIPPTYSALVSTEQVTYAAVDGTRSTYVVTGPNEVVQQLTGPTPPPGSLLVYPQGVDIYGAPVDVVPSWALPSPSFLADLPRETDALLARLRTGTPGPGQSADGAAVTKVDDLLRSGQAPADLRAALYRALAQVPGVAMTADDTSVRGVTGVGFTYTDEVNGFQQTLVVDPADGELVGERLVDTRGSDSVPAGTVLRQTVVSREVVDAVPADVESDGPVRHCVYTAGLGTLCT